MFSNKSECEYSAAKEMAGYGAILGLTVGVPPLMWILRPFLGPYMIAPMIGLVAYSVRRAGGIVGSLTALLSLFSFWYFFVPPVNSFALISARDGVGLTLYACAAVAVIGFVRPRQNDIPMTTPVEGASAGLATKTIMQLGTASGMSSTETIPVTSEQLRTHAWDTPSTRTKEQMFEILVIESDPWYIGIVREVFQFGSTRTNVKIASDGQTALAYIRRQGEYSNTLRPDLVLLDLNLPTIDGWAVLKEIKNDPELSPVPVIVFSASSLKADVVTSYKLHSNCYISKPPRLNEFKEVVRSIERFWLVTAKLPGYSTDQAKPVDQ
jgi:chemotaxis family two-component system response regulator Rcp1